MRVLEKLVFAFIAGHTTVQTLLGRMSCPQQAQEPQSLWLSLGWGTPQ